MTFKNLTKTSLIVLAAALAPMATVSTASAQNASIQHAALADTHPAAAAYANILQTRITRGAGDLTNLIMLAHTEPVICVRSQLIQITYNRKIQMQWGKMTKSPIGPTSITR